MALNSTENRTKRQQYETIRAALWNEKSSFDAHWRELADFVKPKRLRAYVTDRNRGDRRNQKIIDSTATLALRTFTSSLHTGMSNPASNWFKLSTPDPDLAKFKPVKRWLDDVTERMLAVFIKSNIYAAYPMMYGDLGLFGTAAMAIFEDPDEVFRCYPFPMGTYALGMSRRQVVDTFLREYTMTVRQLADEFGLEALSKSAKNLYDRGEFEQVIEVCWIVAPNVDADDSKLEAKYRPWYSCHFEKGGEDDKFLRESGFDEFPVMAPRWERSAEDVYATDSPGMMALGDIKGLQTMTKRKAQGIEKQINPPLNAPTYLQSKGVTILPGGVNYFDSIQKQQGVRPVHELTMPVNEMRLDIEDVRFLIRRAFYEDLFLAMTTTDRREITAREVDERREEKLMVLGHALQNTNDELHEPSINRVFPIMSRARMIPPYPPELEGVNLKIEYLSILSQVQKMVGVTSLDRFVRSAMALTEQFPSVAHKLNIFAVIDEYADRLGMRPDLVMSDDEANASLQAAQQAQAQQRQVEMAAMAAKGARDLGAAPVTGDNALARVLQG